MANCITFRDFLLSQTTVVGKRNPNTVVDSVNQRYKIDKSSGTRTDEIDGYNVVINAAHGKLQTVKLPLDVAETVEKIADAIRNSKVVTINFGIPSTLRGRCYAMIRNGELLSGVSCTASEINIVSIDEMDDFDDADIEL